MTGHSDTLNQIHRLNGGLAWKRVEALLMSSGTLSNPERKELGDD